MTGAAALVLTAWIAPQLWQTVKDPWRNPGSAVSSPWSPYAQGQGQAKAAGKPCCPADMKRRERVKEYFPLQRAHDTGHRVIDLDAVADAALGFDGEREQRARVRPRLLADIGE